ncbi:MULTISPECIES: RluA family pseudouridine synthase [Psychrilyobacter]|uniref:RluA family pseudouridine synthase n=1 Tax=Psychrilyobacter piezotolerans TaxID=2293438 RepID=A0ABX9KHH0_9FUSO|nr:MULTISPECIES: RluA family pseudouridine synthase [Psychrilyobacter]MCS5422358.1 RluA family pseudouridine synthase [Psychrilyobacter sp. S5]NDI78043.1 RluA family pseudouridine synthase [Psychrilyobacter piezotolerans]RDE61979.1 RluA family pseudouridine synthase [Psychrilyobacter sp. S5]REI41205.1 RluA family pseudouridine synthase [Psychrilyobacter piezotolerans]
MDYKITEEYKDTRVDKFVRKKYEGLKLGEIFKYLRTKKIKVNGKKVDGKYRLQVGDVVNVFLREGATVEKSFIELTEKEMKYLKAGIVYEDERVLIFDKKPNMVMHKGSGHDYGLSEMLKAYTENMNFTFVNRIDKATSGMIIGAKTLPVVRELSEEIRERRVEKKYYILVDGKPKQNKFTIKSYLKKTETKVIELDEYEEGAKESISYFKVVKNGKERTLLEGLLGTGRTHQLRVQLANEKLPIVGDMKYGISKESMMYLYSYYVNIPKYNIEIEREIPENFLKKI